MDTQRGQNNPEAKPKSKQGKDLEALFLLADRFPPIPNWQSLTINNGCEFVTGVF